MSAQQFVTEFERSLMKSIKGKEIDTVDVEMKISFVLNEDVPDFCKPSENSTGHFIGKKAVTKNVYADRRSEFK